jgi:hypothetical protein
MSYFISFLHINLYTEDWKDFFLETQYIILFGLGYVNSFQMDVL